MNEDELAEFDKKCIGITYRTFKMETTVYKDKTCVDKCRKCPSALNPFDTSPSKQTYYANAVFLFPSVF